MRAAWAIGSQAASNLDLLMEKLTKLMMVHDFVDGGNDFDRRFEAVERQCVMLSTYTDIISLQPPGTPVEESALDLLVDIVKFLWRHYHTAGDRMQLQLLAATDEFFAELHRRGGATLLRGFASRVTRSLVALTLRACPARSHRLGPFQGATRAPLAVLREPVDAFVRRGRARRAQRAEFGEG